MELVVAGGTLAVTIEDTQGVWVDDMQFAAGTHDLGSLPAGLVNADDMPLISVRKV